MSITAGDLRENASKPPLRFSLRTLLLWIVVLSLGLAGLKVCYDAFQFSRRPGLANNSQSSLNQLWNALQSYHEAHGKFPPAIIADNQGKPMHSWRVLILPYIEEHELYSEYNFNEPWNGPKNSKLANRMPQMFHVASEPDSATYTNVVAVAGEGTAFPGTKSTRKADFKDGTANTILLAEVSDSKIPWLQPCDLDVATLRVPVSNKHQPEISSVYWRRPYVVFADRISCFTLSENIPPDKLRALTTIAGGELETRESLFNNGYLDGMLIESQ